MLPRMSYLTAATESCVNYFREYTAIIDKRNADGVWFEFCGTPLKRYVPGFWVSPLCFNVFSTPSHFPVGVLFDCYCSEALPWRLTLHFTGFPADVVSLAVNYYYTHLRTNLTIMHLTISW